MMMAVLALGITTAFAFKGKANFACSGPLFHLDPVTGYQPVNTAYDCDGSSSICLYYEDERGLKQPCDEPKGVYEVIIP